MLSGFRSMESVLVNIVRISAQNMGIIVFEEKKAYPAPWMIGHHIK
jgi:hypothetical protein